ncbi:MAG TPA: hypothetical protein VKN76_05330 [Kiloniellaceae bacterium]|nr:hypothetical protein [Kiloniellaceae bacterium]
MSRLLLENWRNISKELGFEIEAPFELLMQDGSKFEAPFLVKGFGGPQGMIIVTDYGTIQPRRKELIALGYGYSTLSEPKNEASYSVEGCIRMLSDWGWRGDPDSAPDWILPKEDLD